MPLLEIIYLYKNEIGNAGAIDIANAIQQIKHVAILSLDTNKIGDEGAIILATAIKTQQEMKELYLYYNLIGDKGISKLMTEIKNHMKLNLLDIRSNKLSIAMQKRMGEYKTEMQKCLIINYT